MKKIIAYIISPILYYPAHLISIPMEKFDWEWIYPIYNYLMIKSGDIENWADIQFLWKSIYLKEYEDEQSFN